MTRFFLKMAWRETRAAWRHFLHFFLCIALGVGTLVGIGLFAARVERTISREARGLMGGDIEVRLSRPISNHGAEVLRSLAGRGIAVLHLSELVAMAAATGPGQSNPGAKTQLVELKAVEAGYPFYGTLRVDPARSLADLLAPPGAFGAIVQESLLIKMGLAVGDQLKIGQAVFTVTGLLRHEPDRLVTAFSLGPRVIISRDGLRAADLIKPGSRVRERYLLHVPPTLSLEPLTYELRGRLAPDSARVSTYRDAQPQLKRFLDQLARYLGLIGLAALFVGGIGIASTVHAYLKEKLTTIAILKTIGASSAAVVGTYVFQTVFLGLIGSLAGVALGIAIQGALPSLLASLFPLDLLQLLQGPDGWALLPILKGVLLGILTTLLFGLCPLLSIREVRPALVFRKEVAILDVSPPHISWWRLVGADMLRDRVRLLTALAIAIGLAGLAIWQAGSLRAGLLFLAALALAVVLLQLAAWLLLRLLARVPRPRSVAFRQAVGNLLRPRSQAPTIMASVGIGVMMIIAIVLLERSVVQHVQENRPADAPTFFFIDIQPDQKDDFLRLVQARAPHGSPEATPLVRSRLHKVNGRLIEPHENGEPPQRDERQRGRSWYLSREYVLTFLEHPPKDNTIIKGTWWAPHERPNPPQVSVEEEAARNLGVDLGSIIEFEIQGATVAAEVSSIRRVEWDNFSTNFFMILSPGALDGAPFTYVVTARVPPEGEVPLQQAVVAAFPNVTAINVGEVMATFSRLLEHLSLAVRAVAVFCLLAGATVMTAALATTRYQRLYESVVLKALGATRGLIARSFAAEFALIGAVAGIIGVALASALSWAILQLVLDLPWALQPDVLATGLMLTILFTLTVGFVSTFRILGQRPLAILRHE